MGAAHEALDEAEWGRATRATMDAMRALDRAPTRPEAFLARFDAWAGQMMAFLGDEGPKTAGGEAEPEREEL